MQFRSLIAGLMLFISSTVFGWGGEGHQVVALIAESMLKPKTSQAIHELLGKDVDISDAEIASWADQIKRERPKSAPWHYINIPIEAKGYDADRDGNHGDNVCAKISEFETVLADRSKPAAERAEALKFLVHFIGDIEQPLHTADRNHDRGGNGCAVLFMARTKPTNLHTVWDTDLLRNYVGKAKIAVYSEGLTKRIKPKDAALWSTGTPVDWANQSHDLARDVVYGKLPAGETPTIDQKCVDEVRPVVEGQLQRGGVRLAAVLNRALDK